MNKIFSPSTDFNSVRDGRNAPDFFFDLDLSAPFDQFINVAGNSFYCDANPNDGNFVVYFQETDSLRGPTPFYASPGFIARIPFTQIRVVNLTAQPGKKARVVYGTDTDFQPGSVAQIAIGGSVADFYTDKALNGVTYRWTPAISVPTISLQHQTLINNLTVPLYVRSIIANAFNVAANQPDLFVVRKCYAVTTVPNLQVINDANGALVTLGRSEAVAPTATTRDVFSTVIALGEELVPREHYKIEPGNGLSLQISNGGASLVSGKSSWTIYQ